jgi:predicted ferric reductase
MSSASPLRAALESSVSQPGQWAGPALAIALAGLLAASALPMLAKSGAIGWLAWIAFAISLVLTARLPWLAARFGGLDHQYAWHHMLGLAAYVLALVHPFAVAWPWLAGGDFGTARFAWTYGASPTGWLALALLLLPLAVTFWMPISFRPWLRWHRITALAFAVAALHVAFTPARWSLGWWSVMLTGAVALALRAWVYQRDAGRRYVVGRVEHPANACVEVELDPLDRPLDVRPGQYVFVAFHSGQAYHSCNEYHPFSVSAIHGNRLTLTIKAFGDCTLEMQRLSTGLAARVEGPFGAFFETAGAQTPQLWIAGGIGVTPFLAQLEKLGPDVDIKLAYLFRAGHDALHIDELVAAAEARPGLELATFVTGTDLAPLWQWLDRIGPLAGREVYVCGPPPLLDAVVEQLNARGVTAPHVHFERFDFR